MVSPILRFLIKLQLLAGNILTPRNRKFLTQKGIQFYSTFSVCVRYIKDACEAEEDKWTIKLDTKSPNDMNTVLHDFEQFYKTLF